MPECLGQPSFLSLVPVAAAVSILTPRLCHCLYQGLLPPGTLCVLYAEGQEDRCEVWGLGILAGSGQRLCWAAGRQGESRVGLLRCWVSDRKMQCFLTGPRERPGAKMPEDGEEQWFVTGS